MIIDSGRSSYMYLQNVFADNRDQSLSLALCMAEEQLAETGPGESTAAVSQEQR